MGTEIFAEFRKVFLGRQHAVGLQPRNEAEDDLHVTVHLLSEDDGNWFRSSFFSFSSYWLPELIEILTESTTWMKNNCELDGEWGYKFKSAPSV